MRALDIGARPLVSSVYSTDPIIAGKHGRGFVGIVAKPYDIGEWVATLRRVIRQLACA